jgi:beta-lactamase superfamily II metal-dependent hydrolase
MDLELHTYRCGNADSLALHFPGGAWGVVDCGLPDGREFAMYLIDRGCRELDFVLLTHPDADHYLGLFGIFSAFTKIKTFWMPDDWDKNKTALRKLLSETVHPRVKSKKMKARYARPGSLVYADPVSRVTVTALSPSDDQIWMANQELYRAAGRGYSVGSANRLSVVLGIDYGGTRALLGSDADKPTWRAIWENSPTGMHSGQQADILKVPHHGSADSWDPKVMESLLRPGAVALVSSRGDKKSSPAQPVLCSLTELEAETYCTGRNIHCRSRLLPGSPCCGNIVVTFDDRRRVTVHHSHDWRLVDTGYCNLAYRAASGAQC